MTTEDNVIRLFDQANPVPDVEGLHLEAVGAARHLEALEARSSEVTQFDTKSEQQDKSSIRPSWLVAAVAMVVVGAALLFINLGGGTPAGTGGDVTIEVLVIGAGLEESDFTASGSADICPEGTLSLIDFTKTDDVWTWEDRYTCADGSGTFDLSGEFYVDPEVESPATLDGEWTIIGGTGDYVTLQGSGTIFAKFAPLWRETYTGELSY